LEPNHSVEYTESSAFAKASTFADTTTVDKTADRQRAQSKKLILQILFILSKNAVFRVFRMLKIEVIGQLGNQSDPPKRVPENKGATFSRA
jgi:hypothetical protein